MRTYQHTIITVEVDFGDLSRTRGHLTVGGIVVCLFTVTQLTLYLANVSVNNRNSWILPKG